MRIKFNILLSLMAIGLIVLSCSDDDNNQVTQVSPELTIQMRVGSETLNEGSTYEINGTAIQINVARFYLTNFSFTANGEEVVDEAYHVISPSNKDIELAPVNEGTYDFSFAVGVDSEENSQTTEDFTTRAQGDPLAAQEPAMHWNWNSGYKFLRIDAQVDTDGDGVVDTPTLYHLGSDAFYAILDSQTQVNLSADDSEIGIRFDLEGLFSSIDLSNGESTQTMDNLPLAQQLLLNYTEAFSVLN